MKVMTQDTKVSKKKSTKIKLSSEGKELLKELVALWLIPEPFWKAKRGFQQIKNRRG